MTLSWTPVVMVDIGGSILTVVLAFWCAYSSWKWTDQKRDDIFRHYIYLLTIAIAFFAVSRSVGHLVKQILILNHMNQAWQNLSPFSGAINTTTFVVVFAFGIYFHRFQKVHVEIEHYKENLEQLVKDRTFALKQANRALEGEITERIHMEDNLRQSKTTLENVFNNAIPLCITSIEFDLLQANGAYYAVWPNSGVKGAPIKCYNSRPGAFCHTPNCPMQKILQGEEEIVTELRKGSPGEENMHFIVTARPFRDANGKLIGAVQSFQNITNRKKAEKELASERERLSVTLRSIGDGVITTDTSGNIVLLNRVAEELTGWKQDEARGKALETIFNIVNEKTREPGENPVMKVLESGQVFGLAPHTVLIAKDGSERIIADSGAPIRDKESRIIGAVLVFRDVTEKQRTEDELLKIKKLESVGILAGGIAHDFNNILAAILGNINLAKLRTDPEHKSYNLLTEAEKASYRAQSLTQQLLTFARGGEPVKRITSVAEVIRDSADFILRGSLVRCEYHFADDLWPIEVDSGQISQVIQNIVLNAKDAMPEGGVIDITGENVTKKTTPAHPLYDADYIKISIKDSGAGIATDQLDKIFDPYFSTRKGGSGLGLSISLSIINKHDGHISVDSTLHNGTTFTIFLPARQGEKIIAPLQEVELDKTAGSGTILIMDDDEAVIKVVKRMLKASGFDVLLARDGNEAVAIYKENADRIDLIITDLTVPGGMGGKETATMIHKINPEAKIVVASGYSNDPVMANHAEYGFCAAVSKPFIYRQLIGIISQILPEKMNN